MVFPFWGIGDHHVAFVFKNRIQMLLGYGEFRCQTNTWINEVKRLTGVPLRRHLALTIDGEDTIDGCWSSVVAKVPSNLLEGSSKP